MSVFVQLPERWGDLQAGVVYREGFAARVRAQANPATDRVVLVEPNPWLADELEAQWRWFPNVTILRTDARPLGEQAAQSPYYFARDDSPLHRTFAPDREAVERRFPLAELENREVVTALLDDLLVQVADGEPIALLSIDARRMHSDEMESIDWSTLACSAIAITVTGLPSQRRKQIEGVLKRARFIAAGRPWGEAGDTYLFERPEGLGGKARALAAQARVTAGEAAVTLRDDWAGPSSRARWSTKARVATRRLEAVDILNPDHAASLQAPTREEVEAYLANAASKNGQTWQASTARERDPMQEARECHAKHGVWPISFSYPRAPLPINQHPSRLLSPITPGFPYSYDSESDYLAAYEQAYLGVTHRKAGWDCFRHVEILAAGAVPLMLDAAQIPRFSMVHYPKHAMAEATRHFEAKGGPPAQETRDQFRQHFEQHLTTHAMAQYLLTAAGLKDAKRVLFVDERLAGHADYLSVMTLIGLKQLLGDRCLVQYPVDYVYEDTAIDTQALYGRGFGYTRVLPPEARSGSERGEQSTRNDQAPDVVVVGSVTRNQQRATDLLASFPANKTIWIHGEDMPPTPDEVRQYRQAGTHVFVRAIHANA